MGTLRLSLALGPAPYAEAIGRAERLGFRSIMLRYSPERDREDLHAIKRLAADRGLELPLINGYTNLIHPDSVTLAANRDIFVRAMETALALGADWTNTIIGTRDASLSFWEYHPDNFSRAAWDCAAESIRFALDRFPDERVGRAVEHAQRILAVAAGDRHLHRGEELAASAIEAAVAVVRGGAGGLAVVAGHA